MTVTRRVEIEPSIDLILKQTLHLRRRSAFCRTSTCLNSLLPSAVPP